VVGKSAGGGGNGTIKVQTVRDLKPRPCHT
jgi:hypothetical protein